MQTFTGDVHKKELDPRKDPRSALQRNASTGGWFLRCSETTIPPFAFIGKLFCSTPPAPSRTTCSAPPSLIKLGWRATNDAKLEWRARLSSPIDLRQPVGLGQATGRRELCCVIMEGIDLHPASMALSAISGMTAPAVFVSACGLLMLGLYNKYSRVVGSLRSLHAESRGRGKVEDLTAA